MSINNTSELLEQQRQRELKLLKICVASGLVLSAVFHAAMMNSPVRFFEQLLTVEPKQSAPDSEEIEFVVTEIPTEEVIEEEIPQSPLLESIPNSGIVSQTAIVPKPVKPSHYSPASTNQPKTEQDAAAPELTTAAKAGDIETGSLGETDQFSVGGLADPEGTGNSTDTGAVSTGVVANDGEEGIGKKTGNSNSTGIGDKPQPSAPPNPTPAPASLACLSCPKPEFQGLEAIAKVDMKVRPDGSVVVRLRESSGDPEVDRQTLQTMSQWRYDPQTIPDGGVRRNVSVTYEEKGSKFQRQNELRRQQEQEALANQPKPSSTPTLTPRQTKPVQSTTQAAEPTSSPTTSSPANADVANAATANSTTPESGRSPSSAAPASSADSQSQPNPVPQPTPAPAIAQPAPKPAPIPVAPKPAPTPENQPVPAPAPQASPAPSVADSVPAPTTPEEP